MDNISRNNNNMKNYKITLEKKYKNTNKNQIRFVSGNITIKEVLLRIGLDNLVKIEEV